MKSKCSFILKASTALLLALLMLFGTMSTSLAAVVEELAETGASMNHPYVYFDGSNGSWNTTVYFWVGNGDYCKKYQMSKVANTDYLWYVEPGDVWNDANYYAFVWGYSSISDGNKGGDLWKVLDQVNNTNNKTGQKSNYNLNYHETYTFRRASNWYDAPEVSTGVTKSQTAKVYTSGTNSGTGGTVQISAYYPTYGSTTTTNSTTASTAASPNVTYDAATVRTNTTFTATAATGYNFDGFYDAATGGSLLSSSTTYTHRVSYSDSSYTVYARFSPKTYTISYNAGANGTGSVSSTTKTHGVNATLSSSTFTRSGYTQDGWSTSDGGAKAYNLGGSYTTNADATLYPHWSANSYSITYKDQGDVAFSGTHASGYPTTHTYGTATTLKSASKTGYTFGGWYTNSNCTGTAVTSLGATAYTSNITLYAKWTQKTYAITLSETGASGGTMQVDSAAFTSGSTVTHGNHTFRVDAPSGYVIDTISGIGTWTKSGDNSYATLGSTSITSAQTITVTYAAAGRPSLAAIADVTKDANTTTFNVTATINDEDKKSGTLTATASSSDTTVATVGTPSVSGSTVTIPVTIEGKVDSSTITVNLLDAGSTVSTQTFSVEMEEPTFTIADKTIDVTCKNVAGGTESYGSPAVTPSSISYSSNNTTYITVGASDGTLTVVKTPTSNQTATITATATYGSGYTKDATYTVTLNKVTLTAASTKISGDIGETASGSCSGSNPSLSSSTVKSYKWTSDTPTVVSITNDTTATPTFNFLKNGTAKITLKVTYKNTNLTRSATKNITVNDPTVAFGDTSAASINVGGTVTRTATGSTVGTVTSDTITYSSDATAVATVNSSGVITGKTPGTANISATRTIVCGGQTTTVSTTSNVAVAVKTPVVSLTDATVAVDDTVTLTPSVTNVTGTPTYTYTSSDSTKATVTNAGVVTGVAAGTATITVTATLGTWSGTGTATVTVEAPKVEAEDVDDEDVEYLTVGTNFETDLSNNFNGAYTVTSSNTSVATVSESSGTLTVVPVAKGTATITVTAAKGGNGSNTPGYLKSKLEIAATGADVTGSLVGTGIQAEMTFTVNVSEAEDYKLIVFTDTYSWGSAYIYYNGKGLYQMTNIGKNESNQTVFAYRMPIAEWNSFSYVVFSKDTSWSTQTVNITTKSTGYYISGDGTGVKARTAGTYNNPITIPQVTISDATTPLGTDYTLTATNVTQNSVGKYKWSSATTSVATVTADTGTTASTTVVPVDAGTSVVTVKAFAANPTNWTLTYSDTTLPLIGSTDTATITVTADDKTVAYSAKASYDHADYDSHDGEGGTITTSPNVASGGTVAHGTTVTFTATPSSGYKHVGWRVGTGSNEFTTSAKEIAVRADTTVYALFDKYYTTSITPSAGGTVKVNNANFTGEDVVWNNAPTTITVTPDTGYMIDYANSTNLNKYYTVDTSATSGAVTITGKSDVASGDKTSPSAITVAFKKLSYTVTGSAQYDNDGTGYTTGTTGGTITISNNTAGKSTYEYGDVITITANAHRMSGDKHYHDDCDYMVEKIEFSTDGGTTWNTVVTAPTAAAATHNTTTMVNNTFEINASASSYQFRASFKAVYYFNVYNSWQQTGSGYDFVASPPRKIEVGTGNSKRTFTYAAAPTASDRGEDDASEQAGEPTSRHILATSGTYYEGNLIVAYAGEQIKLNYSGLASSDAIRGVYFNNERRYTCQGEGDDLYKNRVYKAGGWGNESDDAWDYDYMANTTLRAFDYYYEDPAASTIRAQQSGYVATVDQNDHTVTWNAKKNYLNIDMELDYKYRLIINGDDWSKINVTGSYNDEGYYYYGEQVGGTGANSITVSLKESSTSTRTFTGNYTIKKKVGDNFVDVTDIYVGKPSGSASFVIGKTSAPYNTMPAYDLYVDIEVQETYNMKLGNIVVADAAAHKTMITECDTNSTSATTCVGTITAIPKKGDTTGSDISDDGTYYTYNDNGTTNNAADYVYAYTDSNNNKYLNGGVNKGGSAVQEGYSITYTYTPSNNTYGPNYSFVGWFEGSYDNNKFTVNYNKKLSGKPTFSYTPTKNTVIMAVATRDLYLGGNFDSTGNIDGSATWSSGRIKMNFDPTYVKPSDSAKKGRYYYDFENVKADSEYKFRCYDTVSGADDGNLTVWKTWTGSTYGEDNTDILMGRKKYDGGNAGSEGNFMYKTSTASKTLTSGTSSTKNHQANGYGAPVTVYFYAYDGGISVNSTYQWSMAYVSEGAGIDVLDPDKTETTGKYNAPTATVNAKTVGNTGADDVEITTRTNYYGTNADGGKYEKVYDCKVKKKDGAITINACPHDSHVELQAFVVYNIETKKSEAVLGPFTTSGSGDDTVYTGNVTVPQNTKLYIVPVYQFTAAYIQSADLETHTVYVRTDDIDKDDWGGLVAMYSWGTDTRYDSGFWPGQLMIPSDDGSSFYAPLTFFKGQLAGITFNNYARRWGGSGAGANFIATYKDKSVSNVDYSANNNHIYQTYDYREPISIIDNINTDTDPHDGISDIYDTEDMDLTFALKSGDMNNAPTINSAGSGATSRVTDWSTVGYLTDRSGKNRVDLNGNKVNNSTETYHIVAYYTNAYASAGNYDFDPSYNGAYSINWKVYDVNNQEVLSGAYLSASYTDAVVNDEDVTSYIASKLLAQDYPVAGKAVKIAYEKPGTWTEAIRYSGQWYADGVNTLIEGKARVGILSDGVYTPMDTNMIGENYAVVADSDLDSGKGENLVDEFSNTHYSKAVVKKSSATKGKVTFTATNSSNKFIGWYMQNEDGEFEPVNSNYKNPSITPSFNSDITYYAFYSAAATYTFTYPGRNSTRVYSMPGYDLDQDEMAEGGTLNISKRSSDVAEKLAKISDITVFNKNTDFTIGTADNSSPYELKYTGTTTDTTYTTTVYAYNSSGVLGSPVKTVTGTWARKVDLGVSYIANKPSGKDNYKFAGWIKYGTGSSYSAGNTSTYPTILSTQANFGYSVSDNISIEPFFVATDAEVTALRGTGWQAGIDKVGVTQELTSSTTGRIYTDTLINIRNNEATGEKYTGDSGLLVIFQTGESTKDATYSTAFDSLAADTSTIQSFVQSMASGADNAGDNFRSAKLGASRGVGDAYAYRIKTTSLSDLNRADLYMGCDYSQFTGGKFLVVSYTKDGGSYTYSPIKTGTFTPGQKFPAV